MGEDISTKILIDSRVEIVERILSRLRFWDGGMESGVDLVETNQGDYDQLKCANEKLSKFRISTRDEQEYKDKLEELVKEQNKLSQTLKKEQDDLLQGMKELGKKSKVMSSYISVKQESVFVDKDA